MMDSNTSQASLKRRNLRLPAELCNAVDRVRAARPGTVSFNTWIIEAIQEKLTRDTTSRSDDGDPRA